MRRLLNSGLLITLVLSLAKSASWAQAAPSPGFVPTSKLTLDEATAAIRSKEPHSGSSFRLIRELDSSPATREAAQRSLDSASSSHATLYGNGILIELLRAGGFAILEIDDRSDKAISIHLVSRASNGRFVIESNPVEGEVSARIAEALTAESADVVDLLVATPINATVLENKFDSGHFPISQNPDDDESTNLFAIPSATKGIGAGQSDLSELRMLLGTIYTWPIRYAISSPISPADPMRGLEAGVNKLVALSKEFASGTAETLDLSHVMQDLESVQTLEQLQNRLGALRAFNAFLQQKSTSPDALMTFSANRTISTIPLKLGFYGPPDSSYAVTTLFGIVVAWRVSRNGVPVVTRMGLALD